VCSRSNRPLAPGGNEVVIPAPVAAELYSRGKKPGDRALRAIRDLQAEAFDLRAAKVTGLAIHSKLHARQVNESRPVVKYDAMIAGVAHRIGADYLLSLDSRRQQFAKLLTAMESQVQVWLATDAPTAQLRTMDTIG
jgi:predicted nucleic acid-binding protein